MKKIVPFLMSNAIAYSILSLMVYVFYGAVIGVSLMPSFCMIHACASAFGLSGGWPLLLLALTLGLSVYVFFIAALMVFGLTERMLIRVMGFKPGRYSVDSGMFAAWLIYAGLHLIIVKTVLPLMVGTPWAKLFLRLLGCKIGKGVFINTNVLYDPYLLELGDNVVLGGDCVINCHIFEGREIILGKITIGENTLISADAYILPGATIGKNCNIGLRAVVRKNKVIPDHSVIMAVPGLPMKKVAGLTREGKT